MTREGSTNAFAAEDDDVRECRGMLEYPIEECPENVGPFVGDILCCIMLFIARDDKRTLLSVSGVCRMWRFYSNYLPHWTALRWESQLFSYGVRELLVGFGKSRIRSRDELMTRARKRHAEVEAQRRKEQWRRFIEWAGAIALRFFFFNGFMTAILVGHWAAAWSLGISDNNLSNDGGVGSAAFFAFLACLLVEAFLATRVVIATNCVQQTTRSFVTIMMITFALLLPVALVGKRVNNVRFIISNGAADIADLHAATSCDEMLRQPLRAVVNLPASFEDSRWRVLGSNLSLSDPGIVDEVRCATEVQEVLNKTTRVRERVVVNTSLCFTILEFNDPAYSSGVQYPYEGAEDRERCLLNESRPLLVAVDDAVKLRELVFFGNSLPRFRSVMRTDYFNADPDDVMEKWYSATNGYWEASRIQLIHVAMPGGLPELEKQEGGLMRGRDGLLIAVIVIAGLSAFGDLLWHIFEWEPYKDDSDGGIAFVMTMAMGAVLNPVVLLGFGIGCAVKGDDEDPKWLMCNGSGGAAMISLPIIALCCVLAVSAKS